MISTRIEKLKFIVEEMRLAFQLSVNLTESFVSRTLARHILVRAKDFIEHARALRKPLNGAGYDTRDFHGRKEAYASAFDEYFKVARDRLGAHVQDFDFGKRIELWNDIEVIKISFFVEGAEEIYHCLASLNLPGYVLYTVPPESTDSTVLEAVHQYQRSIDSRNWVEVGTDPLAMTRNNTISALNMTPVHARAAQLALIRRWIAIQGSLLDRLAAYPHIARIFKARIITDVVSFCDCLVTRPVLPDALQAMDGLDKLITASDQSSAPIDNFVAVSNFQAELQTARAIRDSVGAHLEVDDTRGIASLLADLDAYDFAGGLNFYERLGATFIKTCRSILFLRLYAADGQRAYGVRASHAPAVAYAGNSVAGPLAPAESPPINDEEGYHKYLTRWLDGDDVQRAEARQFFWHAFASSESVETIKEVEHFGAGQHISTHEFRKAHRFFHSMLSEELSDFDFEGVVELMLSCRSGWPYSLAEVLVRHCRSASAIRQRLICDALGEIGSAPHASAMQFLEACANSLSYPLRLSAAIARFKTFVKAEGIFRINNKGQAKDDYDTLVDSLTTPMSEHERLVCLLAFASILRAPNVRSFSQPFESNYVTLQAKIEALCLPFLKDDGTKSRATTLKQLIQTDDYVGICVLVVLNLDGGDQQPTHAALIENCCNGYIGTAGHDQATRHLAMCFLLNKELHMAHQVAKELASRNPDWVDVQILVAEILGDTLGAEEEATKEIANLRQAYKLTPEFEARIAAVETEIQLRESRGSISGSSLP